MPALRQCSFVVTVVRKRKGIRQIMEHSAELIIIPEIPGMFFRHIPGVFSHVMAGALIIVSFYPVSRPPAFQIRRIIIIRLYTAEDKSLSARFRSIVHVAFRKINSQ